MARRRKKGGARGNRNEKRHEENYDKIEMAMRESLLPDTIQAKYRITLNDILAAMKPPALELFFLHVQEYKFYRSHSELTEAIRTKYPALEVRGILKGCFDR